MTQPSGSPRLIVSGPAEYAGQVMELVRPQMLIGRDADVDFEFDDRHMSRRHARVSIDPSGSVTITDLNSTTGTFVNGQQLTGPQVLRAGDVVRLGDVMARFEPAAATSTADDTGTATEKIAVPPPAAPPATRATPPTPPAQQGPASAGTAMRIGIRSGDRGPEIEHLHRVLLSAGLQLDPRELAERHFGPSTLAAVQTLQHRADLPPTTEINEATLAMLLNVEQRITININDNTAQPVTKPQDPTQGIVTGTLTDGDGAAISDTRITLQSMKIRDHTELNNTTTDTSGAYRITYRRSSPLNLAVAASDATGKTLATSATVFAAPAQVVINLSTSPTGTIRQPSLYTTLLAAVTTELAGTPLLDLQENTATHELTFLANSIGAPFTQVAYLYIAEALAPMNSLLSQTLFGVFVEGTPATLHAALADLPDGGIDTAFTTQVFTSVLGQSRATLDAALTLAVTANVLPPSYATSQSSELDKIDALRVSNTGTASYVGGKTSLNDILAAGNVTTEAQTAFISAYAANGRQLTATWAALDANKTLPQADLTTLQTTLTASQMLRGNLPLLKDTMQRINAQTLSGVQDLALLDQSDWEARIAQVDPQATSIPPVLPNETVPQRIARLAKSLTQRFSSRYPTTAVIGGLTKATTSSFTTRPELITFLTANPSFDFKQTNIDQFIATNTLTISAPALTELKTMQRLHRVSPHYTSVEALNTAGYTSAQKIYFTGRAPFIAQMTTALGSEPLAQMAFARAQMTYATSLATWSRYTPILNWGGSLIIPKSPQPGLLADFPDLQALFGSLDYFECDDCQSVLSPAAYLVDLLEYLSWFTATPLPDWTPANNTPTACDALLARRPDIQYVALSCNNTNIVIPYIDLVNEILEAAIAPTNIARPTWVETEGTTAERAAIPQQTQPEVASAAYQLTNESVFPLSLPFDVDFARATAYIAALGTTRAALLQLFPTIPSATVTAAMLGLNSAMENVVVTPATTDPWARWGLSANQQVIDPNTREPYGGTTSPQTLAWTTALNYVPVLMNRTGLSLQQLYQLLEVRWVTQGAVTLQVGTMTLGGQLVLDPDTDAMVFNPQLTNGFLDSANRFLRLWTACGLQMWELDWALWPDWPQTTVGRTLDNTFLEFLAGAIAVSTQLNLPFQEVLTFWSTQIETRDVTSHLGDEDATIPSTYTEVFETPTVLTATTPPSTTSSPATSLFADPTSLSGAQIIYPASPPATPAQLQPLGGITAALGLDADDISAILAASGAANSLTLPTLTALLCYQRLASSLALSVSDLILWIALTDTTTLFGTSSSPQDTLEFLRRLSVLQATGMAVYDMDYLLRDQSATQSTLTFTGTQSSAVLQTIRDAIAKLTATSAGTTQLTLTKVSSSPTIALTTVQSHGLSTGDLVLVSGVTGNTAANGPFSVTVTSTTSFTLDGSTGNGNWTGGGVVTTNLATTIQTIVVAALVSATGVSADVVTPVLATTSALPLSLDTIKALLVQTTVDASQFRSLIAAFTCVDKAASLFTALGPSTADFTFLVQNAATFGWLNPSELPLTPTTTSPYLAFEKLLRALKLQQRQPARSPKLFDVLAAWISGPLPTDVSTAIGSPTLQIIAATDTTPIAITTSTNHNLLTGQQVTISLVQGNTAANGTYTITISPSDTKTFTLDGSAGNGAYISPSGIVTQTNALWMALNASLADVTALVTGLSDASTGSSVTTQIPVTAPSLTSQAAQAGTLADITTLTQIADALDVLVRYGISGPTLLQLAAASPDANSSNAAMSALQKQYGQNSWLAAVTPVENTLRQNRRDALVAYLLGPGAVSSPGAAFLTTDDIFDYYLIDPEMCACGQTTRLLQPSLAIQQFVQQCFINLAILATIDTSSQQAINDWDQWSWRQQYRLWQAAREVFLYPENYVRPELLPNASPFFTDLQSAIAQGNCDADAVETAYQGYLRSLVGVSRLHVAAHYIQPDATPQGATVLWVFARTHGNPAQWWYRTRTMEAPGSGPWSAWTQLNLDIASDQVVPVVWDQRLHLFWPIFHTDTERQSTQGIPSSGGGSNPPPQKFWALEFAMSEFSAGQWQAKQTYDQRMFIIENIEPNGDRPAKAFTFKAYQDNSYNLQLLVYYTLSVADWAAEITDATAAIAADLVALDQAQIALAWSVFAGGKQQAESNVAQAESTLSSATSALMGWAQLQIGTTMLIGTGTLPMPDAPLHVTQDPLWMPVSTAVDVSQEPTYPYVTQQSLSGSLITPQGYGFQNQDNIFGSWYAPATGSQQLNVLAQMSTNTAASNLTQCTLLETIDTPRIVIPQQERPDFDCMDPFFVEDATPRTYLVVPSFYTNAGNIANLAYATQWNTEFEFQTFYHPYARAFLRELEIGGISQLLTRNLQQLDPQVIGGPGPLNFAKHYNPNFWIVQTPFPGEPKATDPGETSLDFDPAYGGAYSLYNWETFFFIPWFISNQLLANNQNDDAWTWIKYIFNPTDNSGGTTPRRFWEFLPFYQDQASWASASIQDILDMLAVDTQQQKPDQGTATAITTWMNDPFDPHAVASTRISAYAMAIVMQALNIVIALGDSFYTTYTAESVAQAEQWYIVADMLLGPKPNELRLPEQQGQAPTYATLTDLDPFSNTLVNVENLVVAPDPPASLIDGSAIYQHLPHLLWPGPSPSNGQGPRDKGQQTVETLLFCIPPNTQLLQYWDTVADRLYNIRHCLNMQGVAQPLPLYAPPINPMELIEEQAQGGAGAGLTSVAPIYRFQTYLQRAIEMANDVRSYGALILAALEKQDAETLALLRANQELSIQTMILNTKQLQVTEATDQITVLTNQQAAAQIRYNFYSTQQLMNPWEITALSLQGAALISNGLAVISDLTAAGTALAPGVMWGGAGFGGTPVLLGTYGPENLARSASSFATVARSIAGILSESGGMASTVGSYQRRQDEWTLQANLAQADLTTIASQITAANDRLQAAQNDVAVQTSQIANAQAVSDFLTYKYTTAQLYNWMVSQLSTVHTQAYQLAFSLAQQAQSAYQYELGRPDDQFIQFAYWNSQYKGLTAGESLLFDLRRMEAQYIANNARELELTKHISLALTQPTALVALLETGSCTISFDETMFDFDHPGHYFRRLRSVAVTIPCVTGPYTGLNATLTLTQSIVRTAPPPGSPTWIWANNSTTTSIPTDIASSPTVVSPIIATSHGQNDGGLFDVNLRDERWLPFEGQGAVCQMMLELDPRDNNIDLSTVTDVIVHMRYSARAGGDAIAVRNALQTLVKSIPRTILVSARYTFPDSYYSLFNPTDPTATEQTLTLPLAAPVFPYSNLGTPNITDITMIIALSEPLSTAEAHALEGMQISGTFGPASGTAQNVTFLPVTTVVGPDGIPVPATAPGGGSVAALTAGDISFSGATEPGSFTLTIPSASIPAALQVAQTSPARFDSAAIDDIVLLIGYKLTS